MELTFFQKAQWSFFTSRRLIHLNDTFNKLYPKIHNLDKNKTDIAPIVAELEALEQNSKAINRKVTVCMFITIILIQHLFSGKLFTGYQRNFGE